MKDWSGKNLCFECAKKVGAGINIGYHQKGRCHRCHSEQTVFQVTRAAVDQVEDVGICPECAHPSGTHAISCSRSELEQWTRERNEIVRILEETVGYDPGESLGSQLRRALNGSEKPDK